ncbi:vWA domain-containing protein [Phycicoccus flavus]|uniref:vWA domain-containing protein n=1 Tax=Phycicoccus flavus TaxID=2502783 RepID=UPI000FEC18CD|nr:VWA domain-containing protein [Phycicoccus flavus]NHA68895.1 VWA domain-containing protein [Phycicoccus flavus]
MAEFAAAVYQNEFLPVGGTDVSAIVSVTCTGAGTAGQGSGGDAGEIIVIDTSGSMGTTAMDAARRAAQAALGQIVDGTYFAVVSGNGAAFLAYPHVQSGPGMVRMDARTRAEAGRAVAALTSGGGTAMATWLDLTGVLFRSVPEVVQRHAILLTDGANNEATHVLDAAVRRAEGLFQCDCRGVGVDWKVSEVRRIAQPLLGTIGIIPTPEAMEAEFAAMMQASMSRGVPDAQLRVWAPLGAQVLFVRQVSPTVEDLTARRTSVNDLTGDYPTGAWADESRDYHVSVRLAAKDIGQEQLAARVQLVVGGQAAAQGLVKATWSDDHSLTARIDQQVAHYTGQAELAEVIQEGLAAKAVGDEETATTKLGRAVQLAAETGNEEATSRLRKVVDIDDEETGTVRLKRSVDKAAEMELDTASTKTTRVRR